MNTRHSTPPQLPSSAIGNRQAISLALGLALGALAACAADDEADEPWIGEERGALEQVPDDTPSYIDEEELQDVLGDDALDALPNLTAEPDPQLAGWTSWYDRDNPSGDGDWELRYLQAGVCNAPTGVECRTVNGLALWQTGEVVSCSAADGLLCLNASQPDGICNYDYKVRFLCPPPCGNAVCDAGESYATCPQDCHCGNGICEGGENSQNCSLDCDCLMLGYQGVCAGGGGVCCDSNANCTGIGIGSCNFY